MVQLIFALIVLSFKLNSCQNIGPEFHDSQTIYKNYGENCVIAVNSVKEYVIQFPSTKSKSPYTVSSWTDFPSQDHPVFVVIRQQKQVTGWPIPLPINSKSGIFKFSNISRILCHNNMDIISTLPRNDTHNDLMPISSNPEQLHQRLSISISTSATSSIPVTIRVEENEDFYIIENTKYNLSISPPSPKYYYYKFLDRQDANYTSTVILEINSEDDVCLTISIQQPACPVMDADHLTFTGLHQTVESKGGIIIEKSHYPNGFFVVFVAKADNYDCTKTSSLSTFPEEEQINSLNRTANVTFNIYYGLSKEEYLIASFSTFVIILIFYLVFTALTWFFYRKSLAKTMTVDNVGLQAINGTNYELNPGDEIDAKLASSRLTLDDLARKNPIHFEKKSLTYLWHVISIALFYGIPVVQLVVTYQRIVNISGNQDICYYNFLCAHPLFRISDFNHVYSNIGYVLVGVLFVGITFYKEHYVAHFDNCGIPKHFGLFYAMGVALIMEGVLSACYHICPNQSNFQFDTSFMYVMAVLSIVKIYQNRHPDLNATAYSTFLILGLLIFAAMIGILNGHISLWIIYIILHVSLCVYVSFNIYFLSYVKRGVVGVINDWNEDHSFKKTFEPKRKAHFWILVGANIINLLLATMGMLCYFMGTDFATYLLGLLMGNGILYMVFYTIMKLIHHERICCQAIVYGILALICWMGGTYFFVNNSVIWTVTAAKSRRHNMHCSILEFYDYHDIWHLISAPALFFSFMFLLSLDDDLVMVNHRNILVF